MSQKYNKTQKKWMEINRSIEKKMAGVQNHFIKTVRDEYNGALEPVYEESDTSCEFDGNVYAYIDFEYFTVRMELMEYYFQAATDEWEERHGKTANLQDEGVHREIIEIANAQFEKHADILEAQLESLGVIQYLKRAKWIAEICIHTSEDLEEGGRRIIYQKQEGAKPHIDQLIAEERKIYRKLKKLSPGSALKIRIDLGDPNSFL